MDLSTPVATCYQNKMRWVRHVARIVRNTNAYMVCSMKINRPLTEVRVNGRIILEWSLREYTGKGVNCIHVALYTDRCLELVNMTKKFQVE
jgi:hypothetical protein